MGCRIKVIPIQYHGLSRKPKFRLLDIERNTFLSNRSGTSYLEYASRPAAERGHDKHCDHSAVSE